MEIILGSQSPRRKEILEFFSLPFRQIPSHFDEESVAYDRSPSLYAEKLSLEKAKVLQKQYPEALIITADTVVSLDGTLLGKPADDEDSRRMLSLLSGRWHSVITAVSVSKKEALFSQAEETRVLCNRLTPDEIHRYLKRHHLTDKAGGYAIQKSGSLLVNKIEGCYYNVCGLPVNTLRELLQKVGIDLWDYLKKF
jgi:septum formation protein